MYIERERCIYIYICIYTYICIERERERDYVRLHHGEGGGGRLDDAL